MLNIIRYTDETMLCMDVWRQLLALDKRLLCVGLTLA